MNLPPTHKEYTIEWVRILRHADAHMRTVAEKYWPQRIIKDMVQEEVLLYFEVPFDVDLESEEVRLITAHAWGYYCKWYKKLYENRGKQLELFV